MAKATQGASGAFTYDFGIAISQNTVGRLTRLATASLTLASAYYALKSAAKEYNDTLRKNQLRFGGQLSTMKAMEQAQDRLIKGQSYFKVDDQLAGMNKLMSVGINVGKNLEWVNKAAHSIGMDFSEFSGMIANAVNGNLQGLVDAGFMTQRATKYFEKFQGNTIMMQSAIMSFLKSHKGLAVAIANDYKTVHDQTKRLNEVMKSFWQNVVGKPNDPGGVYGTIVKSLGAIADAFSRNEKAIKQYGQGIGVVVTWVVKTVGGAVMWLGKQAKKTVQYILGPSETFVERMRSMVVWLEFWKVHIKKLFNEYKGVIWGIVKALVALKLLKGVFSIKKGVTHGIMNIGRAWKHSTALQQRYYHTLERNGRISNKFFLKLRSFAVYLPGVFRKTWVALMKIFDFAFFKYFWLRVYDVAKNSLLGIVKSGVKGFRLLIGVFRNLGVVIKAVGLALKAAFITNPVGLIIAAVVALVAIFVTLYKKCEGFRAVVNKVVKFVVEYWKLLWNLIVLGINKIVEGFMAIWEGIKWVGKKLWEGIKWVGGLWWEYIGEPIWNGIKKIWDFFAENDFLRTYLVEPLQKAWEWVKKVFGAIGGFFKKLWNGATDWLGNAVDNAGEFLANANDTVAQMAKESGQKTGFSILPTVEGNHDINKRDTTDYLKFGKKENTSTEKTLVNPITDAKKEVALTGSGGSTTTDNSTRMTFNEGAIQINLAGSNIDENKLAKRIKQVILDMEREAKMRGGLA